MILFYIISVLFFEIKCSVGETQSLTVEGPKYNIFIGDVENFTCTVENGVPENYTITWYFIYDDGVHDPVPSSDIFDDYLLRNSHQRISYIKIISDDIKSIACIVSSPSSRGTMKEEFDIKIRDSPLFSKFPTVCDETEKKPALILQRLSAEPSSNYYWASHLVTDTNVILTDPVTSFILKCFSKTDPVEWALVKKPSGFRYKTGKYVNPINRNECYEAILEVGQVNVNSSQHYVCRSPNNTKYQSFIDMDARSVTPTKLGNFTQVEQCLLLLLTGDSDGMTGLSITSSVTALFLLFGIIYVKRQLNLHKDKLKEIVEKQADEIISSL